MAAGTEIEPAGGVPDPIWQRVLAQPERAPELIAAAAAERFGDGVVGTPQLVQVLDRPGVEADQAVFRVESTDGREHRITLGRTSGEWGPA